MCRQVFRRRQRGRVFTSATGKNPEIDSVIPAQAGIQKPPVLKDPAKWIPAFAGMTGRNRARLKRLSKTAGTGRHIGRGYRWS